MTAWRAASACCLAVYMSWEVRSGLVCWYAASRHTESHQSMKEVWPMDPAVVSTAARKWRSSDWHPASCFFFFLASTAAMVERKECRMWVGSIGLMQVLSQHIGHCSGRVGSVKIASMDFCCLRSG